MTTFLGPEDLLAAARAVLGGPPVLAVADGTVRDVPLVAGALSRHRRPAAAPGR